MQHARAMHILEGQSNLARRTFAAVPMQEYWSIGQISNEMNRIEKHNLSKGEITGCLRTLVDAGLVTEAGALTFRSNVKSAKDTVLTMTAPTPKKVVKPTLMERLFSAADAMRKAAEELEAIGMEVDSAILNAGKGDEKLKAIQANLRALMGEEA